MTQATSTSLLEGLRDRGNQSAWSAFCSRYRPLLVRFGQRMGLGDQDAQDAAQETLLAFIENYGQGKYQRDKGRLRNWLLGIARNKVLYLRRQRGRQVQPRDQTGQTISFDPAGPAEARETAIAAWENWWKAHKAEYPAPSSK